jgi:hypothetical protein
MSCEIVLVRHGGRQSDSGILEISQAAVEFVHIRRPWPTGRQKTRRFDIRSRSNGAIPL